MSDRKNYFILNKGIVGLDIDGEPVIEFIKGDRRIALFVKEFHWIKSTNANINEMEDGEGTDARPLLDWLEGDTHEG